MILRCIEHRGSHSKPEITVYLGKLLLTGPKEEEEEECLFPNQKFGIMCCISLRGKGTIYAS
jgi:hypothetical protein